MKDYKYREHEYAAMVLAGGFQTRHRGRELRLAAMYCKEVFGLKTAQCRERLTKLCKEHLEEFEPARDYGIINYAVNSAYGKKACKLITIDSLAVYENEIAYIDSIPVDTNSKKVLFTLLILWRLNKAAAEMRYQTPTDNMCFGGGRSKYRELKKASNIPQNIDICADIIYELAQRHIVNTLHSGLITLDYIYNTSQSGDVAFMIMDFGNIGLHYDKAHGDTSIRECGMCAGLYRTKVNNQRYCCKDCSCKANTLSTRERMRAKRGG